MAQTLLYLGDGGQMSRNLGSTFVTFVMGITVGAVITALYTPTSGPSLRHRLRRLAENGEDAVTGALDHADEFVQKQTRTSKKLVKRARAAFQQAQDGAVDGA